MRSIIVPMTCFAVLSAAPFSAWAQETTRFYAVEFTDNTKQVSTNIVQQAELDDMQARVRQKNLVLTAAIRKAREAWLADQETSRKGFPSHVAGPAEVKILGVFPEKGQADAKLAELAVGMTVEKNEKKSYIEKKLDKLREQRENIGQIKAQLIVAYEGRVNQVRNIEREIEILEEALAKQEAQKKIKEESEAAARALIIAHIDSLAGTKKTGAE